MKNILIISIILVSIIGKSQHLKPIKFASGGGQSDTVTLQADTNVFKKHIGRPNRFTYWVPPVSDSLSYDSPLRIDNPYSISFLHKDSLMTSPFWGPTNNGDLNFSFKGKDRIKQFYETRNGTYEMYYGGTGITGAARSMGLFSYETGWVYNFTEMSDGLGNSHHRFGVGGSAQPSAKLDLFDDLPSVLRPTMVLRSANGLTNDASLMFAGLGPVSKQYNWTIGRNAGNLHRFTIANHPNLRSSNNNFFEIDTTGKVYIPRLKTILSAPATNGMIKTVVVDQSGQLSWTNSGAAQMDSLTVTADNLVKTYKNGVLLNTYMSIKDSLDSKISKLIGQAKGDIITFSSNDVPIVQSVSGTNNYVLKSDNTTTTGLKWEDALGVVNTVNSPTFGTYTGSTALVSNAKSIIFNQAVAVKFNLPTLNSTFNKSILLHNIGSVPIQINDGILTPTDDILFIPPQSSRWISWNGSAWKKVEVDNYHKVLSIVNFNASTQTTSAFGLHGYNSIKFNQTGAGGTWNMPSMSSDMTYELFLDNVGTQSLNINDGTNVNNDVFVLPAKSTRIIYWNGTGWKKTF